MDLAEKVTTQRNYVWKGLKTWKKNIGYEKNNKNTFHVVAIDYGIKKNILRYFSDFNCKVTVVSCKTSAEKILSLKPNGIFLSNGPGDPAATGKYALSILKELVKKFTNIWYLFRSSNFSISIGWKNKKNEIRS